MPAPRPPNRLLPVVVAALVGLLALSGQAGAQTPGAPAITSVTAGDGSLTVAWNAPPFAGPQLGEGVGAVVDHIQGCLGACQYLLQAWASSTGGRRTDSPLLQPSKRAFDLP